MFPDIMESMEREQRQRFEYELETPTMPRQRFCALFLSEFLSFVLVSSRSSWDQMKWAINQVSLCPEEIEFFEKMVDVLSASEPPEGGYLGRRLKLYDEIDWEE
uniref:Uncharacterized protein n=1 Tax=Chromera velia CCMP2878 TaxID=1169474 RepID=A0A0G4I908_9ALVE|eukprot:Cvel_12085.t1-p1 / transcript=Cvel_12085.t1 / gene=Cvel_12085 / organism=Chromera_velia_CCMP2878 / gene_product=hypothetical protein / transcript_product=hypothetical protein / location=Cvel_scaffold778:9103-9411(+) / protein_length=103 / sequence_SO=supercontig / SO=protein_coding / is_pseudo=false